MLAAARSRSRRASSKARTRIPAGPTLHGSDWLKVADAPKPVYVKLFGFHPRGGEVLRANIQSKSGVPGGPGPAGSSPIILTCVQKEAKVRPSSIAKPRH